MVTLVEEGDPALPMNTAAHLAQNNIQYVDAKVDGVWALITQLIARGVGIRIPFLEQSSVQISSTEVDDVIPS